MSAATFDNAAGNEAGDTVAVILMNTSFSSGNRPVSVASSGSKKNSDIAVGAGSPALKGWVVDARRQGISTGGNGVSDSAIVGSFDARAGNPYI